MSCNKLSVNPRPSCGHRHATYDATVCGRKMTHFGVEKKDQCCATTCIPYEPDCPAVWASPAPETVQEAIDRMAAVTYSLVVGGDYDLSGIPVLGGVTGAGFNGDGVNADAFVFCPPADLIEL